MAIAGIGFFATRMLRQDPNEAGHRDSATTATPKSGEGNSDLPRDLTPPAVATKPTPASRPDPTPAGTLPTVPVPKVELLPVGYVTTAIATVGDQVAVCAATTVQVVIATRACSQAFAAAVNARNAAVTAALGGLLQASKDPDPVGRRSAAEGLATFLGDPDKSFRRKAAEALAELAGDAEPAAPALRDALNDPDADVRKHARRALDKLDEIAAAVKKRETLLALANDLKAKETEKRIKALEGIGAYGAEASPLGEHLIEAMRDPAKDVANAASEAFEKVNPKIHQHVFTIIRGTNKIMAMDELSKMNAEAAVTVPLFLYLYEKPEHLYGPYPKTQAAERDERRKRRMAIVDAVMGIAPKDKRVAALILTAVSTKIEKLDAQGNAGAFRKWGMSNLSRIEAAPEDKVKALMSATNDGYEIVDVIGTLGSYEKDAATALPLLKKLKFSPDDKIRAAATEAIKKIE